MCDRALCLRAAVRTSMAQAFPDLRCFVRVAPAGSRWLLVSDAPRQTGETLLRQAAKTWGFPFSIENGLLYLDVPDASYREALDATCAFPEGAYLAAFASMQATAVLLLRHPATPPNLEQAKTLLREGWRAVALGAAQVRQWSDDMRGVLASRLRLGETSGLFACGVLLAAWLAKKEVAYPMDTTCTVNLEE